ncbi:MAG: MoxR family ATPase, partial [Rhodopirellula sp.]|nr:MoxR family ATPase [Rhodopirellula sp.]
MLTGKTERLATMEFLEFPTDDVILSREEQAPERVHVFDRDSVDAVNTALAAKRPLLVRGEPGTGKTQLAQAVARKLKRAFVQLTVDSRTESRDLLWRFDAVRRLAHAQLVGAVSGGEGSEKVSLTDLDEARFVSPGPLWWAFHWESAVTQAKESAAPEPQLHSSVPLENGVPTNGCVVLIDEIDKGETDVPNGLLEALGSSRFPRFGSAEHVCVDEKRPAPLVIVTTNEERTLPDAFLRRCVLLDLTLPPKGYDLKSWLVKVGKAHFEGVTDELLLKAAEMLEKDRSALDGSGPRPG